MQFNDLLMCTCGVVTCRWFIYVRSGEEARRELDAHWQERHPRRWRRLRPEQFA